MKKLLVQLSALSLLVACSDDSTVVAPDDATSADATADASADVVADTEADADSDADSDAVSADTAVDVAVDTAPADAGQDAAIDFTPDPSCAADWVVQVNGGVVNDAEAPVESAKVQLCVRLDAADGRLVCLRPADTGADGTFSIVAPDSARCVGGGSLRVFLPASDLATTYCHVDTETGDGRLDLADDIVLFATDAVEALPEYGDPESARAITFPGGFEVSGFVPQQLGFTFGEDAYANLGARRIDPAAEGLCFLSEQVDGLWAFRVEANVESGFDFRFPNDDEYAAGASVDLFVLGGLETKLDDGSAVPETEFRRYGTATVSEDGLWVEGRIPAFTWFGYALAE